MRRSRRAKTKGAKAGATRGGVELVEIDSVAGGTCFCAFGGGGTGNGKQCACVAVGKGENDSGKLFVCYAVGVNDNDA